MLTDTKPAPSLDPAAALSGILALAEAGLSDAQIATITADDARREQSVIDRARMVLLVPVAVRQRKRPSGGRADHVGLVRAAFLAVAGGAQRRGHAGDARRREAPPGGGPASRARERGGGLGDRWPGVESAAALAAERVDRHPSSSPPRSRGWPTSARPWSA